MKRVRFVVKALMLSMMVYFLSCSDVTNESYPTKTIDSLEVSARSYSGVNIITWKAVKDARAYSIYRTADGKNGEDLVLDRSSDQTFYIDNDVEAASSYKYRVIAHPLDSTVHDAAQREVSLTTPKVATDSSNKKGTWASANTSFLDLAQYESDYNPSDAVLSANTIKASLLTSSGSKIRVKFPVKPYASYTVKVGQLNGALLGSPSTVDNTLTINGFDYTGTATVDLTAVYSGEKEVTVVAKPYGMLYNSFTVAASSKVTVASYDAIDSAVVGDISVKWTNYYKWSKTAYSRIRFVPASLQGKDFALSEYKIYRAVINASGETISSDGKIVYGSITELGSPSKDVDASTTDTTVYYYDDNLNISTDSDVSAVRYYVILNHDDKIKTANAVLLVPDFSDENWNYVPEEKPEGYAYIQHLTLNADGYLTVTAYTNGSETPKFTYGDFETYNQALVAVEKELQSKISLNYDYGYYDGSYNYSGSSNNSLSVGRYYAFRFVTKTADGAEAVHKIIAVPQKIGDAYYLSIKSESRPHGYDSLYVYPSVSVEDKRFGSVNYESIKIRWDVGYQDVRYYNIYRASSFDYPDEYNSLNFTFVATKTNDSHYGYGEYTDETEGLKNIGIGYHVFYKIEPVGRYNVSPTYGTAYTLGLKAPTNIDVALFGYNNMYYNDYTYRISWTTQDSYSSDKEYCIFHYSPYSTMSEETVKRYFESSPSYYQTDTVSFGTTTYDVSFSDTTGVHYYAVGTRIWNNGQGYVYAISDVKKISWSGEILVNTDDSGKTFTLIWSEISGATHYKVYCAGSNNSSITDIGSNGFNSVYATSYTYENDYSNPYVFFFVVGVDDYGQEVGTTTVFRTIALPIPTGLRVDSDNTLHWDAVGKVSYYKVCYARTQEALDAGDGYYSRVNENSYSVVDSYTNDYYYAVKACDDYGNESKLSTSVYVPKKVLESPVFNDVTLYGYDSYDRYTYKLSWYSSEAYSSDKKYCIFHHSAYSTASEETVKMYFENYPDSYQTDIVDFGTTAHDVLLSATSSVHYYAVGTRAWDSDTQSYVYGISDVKKISWSGNMSGNTEDSGNTFELTWSEIPDATQYRVYCVGSSSFSITNISSESYDVTSSTSYTYNNVSNYWYVFFFAVGINDYGEEVGTTTIYRWS